jgi:DNA-binding CsgD family transcriptional regulator
MAPSPDPPKREPPEHPRAAGGATERDSIELLEALLDLTLNVFTHHSEAVAGQEVRPAAELRRHVASLGDFWPPQERSMSERLRAAVMSKRRELLAAIARNAATLARRLDRHRSVAAAAALRDLWQKVASVAVSAAELDLLPFVGDLRAAVSGPARQFVGLRDPLKFREDVETLKFGDETERRTVLRRWTAKIEPTWLPQDPRVSEILRQEENPSKLKREALNAGLWEAVTKSNRLQRVRLGKMWIKDHAHPVSSPKPMRVRPAEYLEPEEYWLWLRRRATAHAERILLEDSYPDREDDLERASARAEREDDRPNLAQPPGRRHPRTKARRTAIAEGLRGNDDPEALLLQQEAKETAARELQALLEVASPRQRELLAALEDGATLKQAAEQAHMDYGAAKSQMARVRKKAGKPGRPPGTGRPM